MENSGTKYSKMAKKLNWNIICRLAYVREEVAVERRARIRIEQQLREMKKLQDIMQMDQVKKGAHKMFYRFRSNLQT